MLDVANRPQVSSALSCCKTVRYGFSVSLIEPVYPLLPRGKVLCIPISLSIQDCCLVNDISLNNSGSIIKNPRITLSAIIWHPARIIVGALMINTARLH